VFCIAALMTLPLEAATIGGSVADSTGAALPGARVVVRDVATGQETVAETDGQGQFSIDAPATGTYLIGLSVGAMERR
jgi:carboxypeptidase family protein